MNICNSTLRIGSMVAYGIRSSTLPPRSSMSMRSRTRMAALAGRLIAAKRGLVSRRSIVSVTGDSGRKACSVSASTTSIKRLTRFVSIVV
jgi:hypothetical protein